jgi:uncharacterized protein (TIGR03437 family)
VLTEAKKEILAEMKRLALCVLVVLVSHSPVVPLFRRGARSVPPLALWLALLLLSVSAAASAQSPGFTEYPIPTSNSLAFSIAKGPDGALWFTEANGNKVGRITTAGVITEYTVPTSNAYPRGITSGPDGALWFVEANGNKIGRITTSGVITEYVVPTSGASPTGIAAGSDGTLWFTEANTNKIGRIMTSGAFTEYPVSTSGAEPWDITAGPDGALWFTEANAKRIGRITTSGTVAEYPIPAANGYTGSPSDITNGSDGALWFDESPGGVGRITTTAAFTLYNGLSGYSGITAGPDGALWVTAYPASLGRFTTSNGITYYNLATPKSQLAGITTGPDGALWFVDYGANQIGKAVLSAAPLIANGGIVPADSTVTTIQPGEWVSIYGNNLATSAVNWNGNFPTSLGGTSVTINGKAAYLSYVSPTQINLQAPNDTAAGAVPVVVTTANGSATSTVTLSQFGPSFFLLDAKHVAGIIVRSDGSGAYGGGTYDVIGPTGTSLGYPTVAAKAGDIVELFGTGFGPTNPAVPAGQVFSGAAPTTNPVNVLINDNYVSVTPMFAGLSGAGLYQINLTVPAGLGTGDFSLVATVGSVQTPPAAISLRDAVGTGPGAPCANVGGTWNASESGSYTETIAATAETDTATNPISGSGTAMITQTGCSIQYNPISETGLIGSNLTPSQLASMTRTGTVSGNDVSVTGLVALVDTVASAQAGFTVTNISSNVLNASGQVAGNPPVMKLNETGTFVASGTYSISGQSGSFTETVTTSSTAAFARGGVITTVSGGLAPPVCTNLSCGGFSGDGGPASAAQLLSPGAVAVDAAGNLFIADTLNQRIRKVSTSGIITTVAGSGTSHCGSGTLNGTGPELCGGFSGDGGPATSAQLSGPMGVAVDASGNLFIADTGNNRIRKVSAGGIITTVAGNGTAGFSGDYAPGTSMELYQPHGVAVDTSGNVFIADTYNNRIRMLSPSGIIATVAGSGPAPCITPASAGLCGGFSGDGGLATAASLYWPDGVVLDASGNLFIADSNNGRVRKVSLSGTITTVAGGGPNPCGFYDIGCVPPPGDGGPATSAVMGPVSVVVDVAGDLFITDSNYSVIRTVSASNSIITTVAGIPGHAGSAGGNAPAPATSADLYGPTGIALDAYGNLFIADSGNNRIREVSLVAVPAETPSATPSATPSITPAERMGVRFAALAGSATILNVVISLH